MPSNEIGVQEPEERLMDYLLGNRPKRPKVAFSCYRESLSLERRWQLIVKRSRGFAVVKIEFEE
jgi:hypothetical protein